MRLSAVQRLVLALFCIFIWSAGVVALTVDEPWLGVTLATDDDRVQVADRDASGPAAAIEPGAALISIAPVSGSGEAIRLVPLDLVEEPDTLEPTKLRAPIEAGLTSSWMVWVELPIDAVIVSRPRRQPLLV